jgi:FkbM family methyltransferase
MDKKELKAREPELVRAYLGERSDGFFVEVGANEPKTGSQTWHLEERGWRGALVEPLAELAERLRRARPRSQVFEAACSSPEKRGEALLHVGEWDGHSSLEPRVDTPSTVYSRRVRVKVMTLDEVLEEAHAERVDFVSIDTEGTELDVLKGFGLERWRPALLLIEDKVHSLDKHRHLKRHGYRLVKRTGFNNWYVPRGAPRPQASLGERWNLVRKLYLAMPWRVAKLRLKRRRASRGSKPAGEGEGCSGCSR